KGLGSIPENDTKRFFRMTDMHVKRCRELTTEDSERVDMAFSKRRIEDRKKWLFRFDKNNKMNVEEPEFAIKDFIDKDLIEFSMDDNIRSIPSAVDGLKPVQRKILFTA